MTDREAMQMALAKFEHLWDIGIDAAYKVELLPEIRVLRQALAQPEIPMSPEHLPQYIATNNIKPTTEGGGGGGGGTQPEQDKLLVDLIQEQRAEIDRLRQALAQPEQEPDCSEAGHDEGRCGNFHCITKPATPRKAWVGLTDDERNEMIGRIQHDQYTRQRDLIGSTQIITEMYLKEKNSAL